MQISIFDSIRGTTFLEFHGIIQGERERERFIIIYYILYIIYYILYIIYYILYILYIIYYIYISTVAHGNSTGPRIEAAARALDFSTHFSDGVETQLACLSGHFPQQNLPKQPIQL